MDMCIRIILTTLLQCGTSVLWIIILYIVINSYRYIFLEYSAPSHAHEAVKNADGYKLDKQHTFRVNLFTDFDKYVIFKGLQKYAAIDCFNERNFTVMYNLY